MLQKRPSYWFHLFLLSLSSPHFCWIYNFYIVQIFNIYILIWPQFSLVLILDAGTRDSIVRVEPSAVASPLIREAEVKKNSKNYIPWVPVCSKLLSLYWIAICLGIKTLESLFFQWFNWHWSFHSEFWILI